MILFLDFDGVLHPDGVVLRQGAPVSPDGRPLFRWASVLEAALAPYSAQEVQIVLSTTWVTAFDRDYATAVLPPALRSRVVDVTWEQGAYMQTGLSQGHFKRLTRYKQVEHYVRRNRVEHWLAIDNDPSFPASVAERFVKTADETGLSLPAVQQDLQTKLATLVALERAANASTIVPPKGSPDVAPPTR